MSDDRERILEDPDLFFKMESDYKLFNIRSNKDIPLWDIFRAEVWNYIIYKEDIKSKPRPSVGAASKMFMFVKQVLSLLKILLRKDYFFFGVSRFVDQDGRYYDPYLESIKPLISNRFLLYETVTGKPKYRENGVGDITFYLLKAFRSFYWDKYVSDIPVKNLDLIICALRETYGYEIVSRDVLLNIYFKFKVHYYFYKFLFRFGRFKAIFLHQNGFQKGLIFAAQKLDIPVLEFQHADVIEFNIVWHYGTKPNDRSDIIFPDLFLTYSNFWSESNNIPTQSVEIGTAIHNISGSHVGGNAVAIISTKEHEDELNVLTISLAKLHPSISFQYKLHPAQYDSIREYEELFSKYVNINVVPAQMSISDLIAQTDHYIVIYSSVIFELLQSQKHVYLFERQNYWFFRQFFTLQGVTLFKSPSDFRLSDLTHSNEQKLDFYKPLQLSQLKNLLTKLYK
ncbi:MULTISPECIES: hypothetical protein [unclassified Sphingobacterium]|uniref:hypothetical protein n=1 Tax=unclassified Sphingobacterium TaxID=2609468 RepID=UPI0025FE5AE3|nr:MULTISPECIES: hypothetical protein [unclassified Sphingobacterium]